jgi:hypothetical protein
VAAAELIIALMNSRRLTDAPNAQDRAWYQLAATL